MSDSSLQRQFQLSSVPQGVRREIEDAFGDVRSADSHSVAWELTLHSVPKLPALLPGHDLRAFRWPPADRNISDLALKEIYTALRNMEVTASDAFATAYRLLTRHVIADNHAPVHRTLDQKEPAAREWLIEGWLPAHRLALLIAPGGTGKSRLAMHLAAGLAAGEQTWLPGGPPLAGEALGGTAVYATWEDEVDQVRRVLWDPETCAPRHNTGDRFHLVDCMGSGPLWRGVPDGRITELGAWLLHYCANADARLLVIDPSAGAYAGDENSRAAVRAFVSNLDAWARSTQCAVLVVGHPPKSGAAYSGSTDWLAGGRAMWTMRTDGEDRLRTALELHKSSYGEPVRSLMLSGYPAWRVVKTDAPGAS